LTISKVILSGIEVDSILFQNTTVVILVAAYDLSMVRVNGDVVLISSSGAVVGQTNLWTYVTAGNIATISPSSGQVGTRNFDIW
jgi:hypothetical protein